MRRNGEVFDLVIVGIGSGGAVAAELAARIGLHVAVVERDRIGGDCLWTGCVPSKTLIAAARTADAARHADRVGLGPAELEIDPATVWARIRSVQEDIARTDDDPERFRALGVTVVRGVAHLAGPHDVLVDGRRRLRTGHILLCTGSRPAVPDIEGLRSAQPLTTETFWTAPPPPRLLVVGGGPVGVELAQACARLRIDTTLVQRAERLLPREEPELVEVLEARLGADGVAVHTSSTVDRVVVEGVDRVVHGTDAGRALTWRADQILLAAGRRPNVEDLGLEELGIAVGSDGIEVDDRGRTAVATVSAAGDVAGRHAFTHAAAYEAARAVRDIAFPGKGKVTAPVPWCTFTDPELARIGLTIAEARHAHGRHVEVHRWPLTRSDRARTDAVTDGAVVVVTAKGTIVGAHVLAPTAGEVIHELVLAHAHGMKLDDLASVVHVYPTIATSVGQLAAETAFARAGRLGWLARLTARATARRRGRRGSD